MFFRMDGHLCGKDFSMAKNHQEVTSLGHCFEGTVCQVSSLMSGMFEETAYLKGGGG